MCPGPMGSTVPKPLQVHGLHRLGQRESRRRLHVATPSLSSGYRAMDGMHAGKRAEAGGDGLCSLLKPQAVGSVCVLSLSGLCPTVEA